MKTETFHLDLITPCFCAGANKAVAEIRPASIRGQLRWWFRTLGGFTSLAPMPVPQQEAMIFGSIAGGEGTAGNLTVRIRSTGLVSSVRDGQELGHPNFSEPAYLTFPIQSREKNGQKTQYNGRGVFTSGSFELLPIWRGQLGLWEDIRALVAMFGHLGALGFRGRRAMGALGFSGRPPLELVEARSHFLSPDAILIKQLPAESAKDAVSVLGSWLKSCRSHGRSGQNNKEMKSPFFKFAVVDHDIGYNMQNTKGKPSFRPALGLPIIQRTNNGTNNWDFGTADTKGRFASPVLLRPHRDAQNQWHALVIFVDAHQWIAGNSAFLNGQEKKVSLELYEAMKGDDRLNKFLD